MNNDKTYNDALGWARRLYKDFLEIKRKTNAFVELDDLIERLEEGFPELKESEDEGVRKALLKLVLNDKNNGYTDFYKAEGITCDDAIAYLEKLKEFQFGYPGIYFYDGEKLHFQGNPAMEEKEPNPSTPIEQEQLHFADASKMDRRSYTALRSIDLMLGDWVRRRWTCNDTGREVVRDFQITEIRKNGETLYVWGKSGNMGRVEELEPIPLTPEILEKNGFELRRENVWRWISEDERTQIRIVLGAESIYITKNAFYEDEVEFSLPCPNCVHELQHALRLCGIKKEIEL